MFKQILLVFAVVAFVSAAPNPKAKPDYLAPILAETPIAYSADYVAPLTYSAHYTAPLTYSAYSAYPYPIYASSYYSYY